MEQNRIVGLLPCLVLTSALCAGCIAEVTAAPPPLPEVETGSLTVLWTVNGRTNPAACRVFGRGETDFELLVLRGNRRVMAQNAPCEDFGLTVELRPGEYTGYTTLVDKNDEAVTTTLPVKDITIVEDTDLRVDVDFPAGSFL